LFSHQLLSVFVVVKDVKPAIDVDSVVSQCGLLRKERFREQAPVEAGGYRNIAAASS
jgi:hypothetical protein